MVQAASWYAAIAQICAMSLTLVVYVLTYRRLMHRKRMTMIMVSPGATFNKF